MMKRALGIDGADRIAQAYSSTGVYPVRLVSNLAKDGDFPRSQGDAAISLADPSSWEKKSDRSFCFPKCAQL
jgi:hypothetical protein